MVSDQLTKLLKYPCTYVHNRWQSRSLEIISCHLVKLQIDIIVLWNSLSPCHPPSVIYYYFSITTRICTFSFCQHRVFAYVLDTIRFAAVDLFELYNRISFFSAKRKFPRSRFVPAVWIRYVHTYTHTSNVYLYVCAFIAFRFHSVALNAHWKR